MKRKKITLMLMSLILMLSTTCINAETFDNGKMWYDISSGGTAFDIKGYYNGSLYRTTFNDNGYTTTLYTNGRSNSYSLDFPCNGSTTTYDGISVTLNIIPISGGNYLKIEYTVKNNNSVNKTISLSTDSDVKIGSNDRAPIYSLDGNSGFRMTDGNAQFMFIGKDSYGVTDVDYYWFGQYNDRTYNRFNQSSGSVSGIDSGMAFTWADKSLAPGETKKFSALLGVGELNYPPTLTVTSKVEKAYYAGETVPITGIVNDRDSGDTVQIKYALDDGTEYTMPQSFVPNNNPKNFSTNFIVPKTTKGKHNLKIWAVDSKGNMSKPVSVDIDVAIDSTPPTAFHTISTSSWTNEEVNIKVTASDSEKGVKRIKLPDGNYVYDNIVNFSVNSNGSYIFVLEDNVGNVRDYVVKITNIDKSAPDILLTKDSNKWSKSLTINGEVLDKESGVEKIKLPDGKYIYSTKFSYEVFQNGRYVFEAEDKVGNKTTKSIYIDNVDNEKPTIKGAKVENLTKDGYDVIVTGVTDNISGIDRVQFPTWTELNGQDDIDSNWSNSSTSRGEDLGNGTWRFHVNRNAHKGEYGNYITNIYAYDKAGNYYSTEVKANLDNIAPNLDLSQNIIEWTKENVIIVAKASDKDSGVRRIKLPNGTYTNGDEAKFEVNKNGKYTFVAEDNMGNTTTKTITISNIDREAPVVNINSNPSQDKWTNGNVTLNIEASDIGLGVDYIKLPNGNMSYSNTFDYLVTENGEYTFIVMDKAGNKTTKTFIVKNIDRQAPTKPTIINTQEWNNAKQVPVTIKAGTDAQSGIRSVQYKLEGATQTGWLNYRDVFNVTNEGITKITARTVDNVGQYSSETVSQVKIDRTAPDENDITIIPIKNNIKY